MKFLLADQEQSLLIAGKIADWRDLALTRWNQAFRTDLGDALCQVADRISNNGTSDGRASGRSGLTSLDFRLASTLSREKRNELVRDLRIIASSISNNGANEGSMGGLRWRLEVEPVAEPAEDEAA